MGDVQFDDESGEGDAMVVERRRDLALSAQARQMVADIDIALERMANGTYGYSVISGRPIPKERLEADPRGPPCSSRRRSAGSGPTVNAEAKPRPRSRLPLSERGHEPGILPGRSCRRSWSPPS